MKNRLLIYLLVGLLMMMILVTIFITFALLCVYVKRFINKRD